MHTQVERSAQYTRTTKRTKRCIRITAWATRILAILSIVYCIVAFVTLGEIEFGILLMVTAILSVMSPLNFNCCCYSDCSRNTKTDKAIGHCGVYVWMFMSNMGYVMMFGYSWYFWIASKYNNYPIDYTDYDQYPQRSRSYNSYSKDNKALLDAIFAFTLIITFFLSILNLYTFCLVYKYGCCFMNEVYKNCSQQNIETAVVISQHISARGGLPVNGVQFTNARVDAQQPFTSTGVQYLQYQP
ncbi:uncharacterized protein LOC128224005 [Mya arenaria]|nr:uncharacterized protein LOC128224005 [Mya arenaria]